MMNTKLMTIACLLAGLLLGYALRSLLQESPVPPNDFTEQQQRWETRQQHLKQLQQTKEALQQQSRDNARQLTATSHALSEAKQQYEIVLRQNKTLREQYAQVHLSSDTPTICDTIISNTTLLISRQAQQDTVYEQMIHQQAEQITVKDSIAGLQEIYIGQCLEVMQECSAARQQLLSENESLKKQYRRNRLKQKLLPAAGIIAGAAAVYGLLR